MRKTWKVIFFALVIVVFFLPQIVTPFAQVLYTRDIHAMVERGIDEISKNKPYCIIAPVLVPVRNRYARDWQIIPSVQEIDFDHILDHAVREKLILYAKEGRGARRRGEIGREMHFGVLVQKTLYIWSFKEQQFIELPFKPHRLAGEFQRQYQAFRAINAQHVLSEPLKSEDYFCPHLQKSG